MQQKNELIGEKGNRGLMGEKGNKGDRGQDGLQGKNGPPGPKVFKDKLVHKVKKVFKDQKVL